MLSARLPSSDLVGGGKGKEGNKNVSGNKGNPTASGAIGNKGNPTASGAIGNKGNPKASGAIGNKGGGRPRRWPPKGWRAGLEDAGRTPLMLDDPKYAAVTATWVASDWIAAAASDPVLHEKLLHKLRNEKRAADRIVDRKKYRHTQTRTHRQLQQANPSDSPQRRECSAFH